MQVVDAQCSGARKSLGRCPGLVVGRQQCPHIALHDGPLHPFHAFAQTPEVMPGSRFRLGIGL
eukprot:9780787-Heterocapsa_arctica.AAC.1